ncbi:MAG: VOC family protein [Thermoproteota archaeon]|nr:VOC family protein [Thermoproteota archaeon]
MHKGHYTRANNNNNKQYFDITGFIILPFIIGMEEANQVPSGFHSVTPYLIVSGASRLIDFLKQVFDAKEIDRFEMNNAIMHAVVKIGNSNIMISDSNQFMKPIPSFLYVYVANVDDTYQKALRAGATSTRAPTDEFYGDRGAGIVDFAGNNWYIATHKRDIPREELKRLAEEHFGEMGQ